MALQTPHSGRSGLQRPSFGNSTTSPSLRVSTMNGVRKTSLQPLPGQKSTTPVKMDAGELDVGDVVNVPGEMYGVVKFIGAVRGKNGQFVGVELDREFAARGKNDGDVDGTYYFNTTIPGAGIFLPVHRAEKRHSPINSPDSFPGTPNTPSYSTGNGRTPSVPLKFSQSVGPGVRASSPALKPRRPSLPRPESPLRRQPPHVPPTPGRNPLASSQRAPRSLSSAATPSKPNFKGSTTARPSAGNGPPARPYSRAGSRVGHRPDAVVEEETKAHGGAGKAGGGHHASQGSIKSFSQPLRSQSRLGSTGGQDEELLRLRAELAERDKRLADQAANLADMEASVKELSGLLPTEGQLGRKASFRDDDDANIAQLRQMLREKNEKITLLTSEFDAHRADFRSTLDSLEMASSETERVYEEQKRDLLAQVQELTERTHQLEELNQSKKEFDDVARQLKGLEEFVQELEEGLEDARRGEAEARGEVEFLRGEVERGRSELKREREKAAAAMSGSGAAKELQQKEDEIQGLKAIIHSFSTSPNTAGSGAVKDLDEIRRLKMTLAESQKEKEALEQEAEQLRRTSALTNGHHARNESEKTAVVDMSRPRGDTITVTLAPATGDSGDDSGAKGSEAASTDLFCEMCESSEHDTLDCTQFQTHHRDPSTEPSDTEGAGDKRSAHARFPSVAPSSLSASKATGGKENDDPTAKGTAATSDGESGKAGAEDKWCALCERDGHLAYECPDEQY